MYEGLHVKYVLFFSDLNSTFNFLDSISKSTQISNFIKIHPVGAEFFHADGLWYGEADSLFSQFCEQACIYK